MKYVLLNVAFSSFTVFTQHVLLYLHQQAISTSVYCLKTVSERSL